MAGYIFDAQEHGQFDPNGRVYAPDPAAHNRRREAAELAKWAEKPTQWVVYIVKGKATTWLGSELGSVTGSKTWTRYGRRLGSYRMTSVEIRGSNGAIYRGRYGSDWASACRITRRAS